MLWKRNKKDKESALASFYFFSFSSLYFLVSLESIFFAQNVFRYYPANLVDSLSFSSNCKEIDWIGTFSNFLFLSRYFWSQELKTIFERFFIKNLNEPNDFGGVGQKTFNPKKSDWWRVKQKLIQLMTNILVRGVRQCIYFVILNTYFIKQTKQKKRNC
jgi:hypothetical protein